MYVCLKTSDINGKNQAVAARRSAVWLCDDIFIEIISYHQAHGMNTLVTVRSHQALKFTQMPFTNSCIASDSFIHGDIGPILNWNVKLLFKYFLVNLKMTLLGDATLQLSLKNINRGGEMLHVR